MFVPVPVASMQCWSYRRGTEGTERVVPPGCSGTGELGGSWQQLGGWTPTTPVKSYLLSPRGVRWVIDGKNCFDALLIVPPYRWSRYLMVITISCRWSRHLTGDHVTLQVITSPYRWSRYLMVITISCRWSRHLTGDHVTLQVITLPHSDHHILLVITSTSRWRHFSSKRWNTQRLLITIFYYLRQVRGYVIRSVCLSFILSGLLQKSSADFIETYLKLMLKWKRVQFFCLTV